MTNLLIKLFVKNYSDTENTAVRENYGTLSGVVGIVCNLILCFIKILVGSLSASISIVADGLNNLSDMGSSVITMIGFKLSNKPADADHPFGHGRFEYVSAFTVAFLIVLVGVELFKSSITALVSGDASPQYGVAAIAILAFSILLKLFMFVFNKKISKKINSEAVAATAQDSINDVLATAVILISVFIQKFVTVPFNLDAVMGIGVALFILYAGINTAKDTIGEILGTPPSKELVENIKNTVMSFDGFEGIHDLIVHNYGPGRCFASLHVEVPSDVDIVACHEKIDLCEKLVGEKCGIELVIHMDPIDVNNEEVNRTRTQISEIVKSIDADLSIHDFRMTPKCENRTNLIFDTVVPSSVKIPTDELRSIINEKAKELDETFCCVITFDNDYTGK